MRWLMFLFLPLLMAVDQPLEDARAEARALALMEEIRCVACENEPISQSHADIAADMRKRVREMIDEGASDSEVRNWFSDRYGEFVLFRPTAGGVSGILLWGLPFALLLLIGGGLVLVRLSRSTSGDVAAVAPETFDHDKENGF